MPNGIHGLRDTHKGYILPVNGNPGTIDKPFAPIPLGTLARGVTAALPVIASGGKVLCHCRYGIHRSVAMACCVLIGKGYSADNAMQLVAERRSVADPYVGYIQVRIRKFEQAWQQSDT